MTLSSEDKAALIALSRALTRGELSTIVASLRQSGSQIGTSRDSNNFAFLQRLADLGLATELPLEIDLPPELQAVLTSFLIHDEAKSEIESLLRERQVD